MSSINVESKSLGKHAQINVSISISRADQNKNRAGERANAVLLSAPNVHHIFKRKTLSNRLFGYQSHARSIYNCVRGGIGHYHLPFRILCEWLCAVVCRPFRGLSIQSTAASAVCVRHFQLLNLFSMGGLSEYV